MFPRAGLTKVWLWGPCPLDGLASQVFGCWAPAHNLGRVVRAVASQRGSAVGAVGALPPCKATAPKR